jgi:hypothetical protein
MCSARALTLPATRRENSGLSMVMSASGFSASTASAVCETRASRLRRRGRISVRPMTDSSSIGKSEVSPSACIKGPPMP